MRRRRKEIDFGALGKRAAAKAEELCDKCGGSGRLRSEDWIAKARRGGNTTYLRSQQPGQMSMSERGKRGGAATARIMREIGG